VCPGSLPAGYLRIADVGITVISSRLPSIVISASAKPNENALCSSTSLKKTNGSIAIDVKGLELATAATNPEED